MVFLPLYLEPVLVINDRETNPTRHEFYIRLFICTHAVLLHSSLRDGSAQLGMEGEGPQDKSCAVSYPTLWNMSLFLLNEKKKAVEKIVAGLTALLALVL